MDKLELINTQQISDIENVFANASEEEIISFLKKSKTTENILPVTRGMAVMALVKKYEQKNELYSLRQIIREIEAETGISYTALFYSYQIVRFFGDEIFEDLKNGEEIPSFNQLRKALNTRDPKESYKLLKETGLLPQPVIDSDIEKELSEEVNIIRLNIIVRKELKDKLNSVKKTFGSLELFFINALEAFDEEEQLAFQHQFESMTEKEIFALSNILSDKPPIDEKEDFPSKDYNEKSELDIFEDLDDFENFGDSENPESLENDNANQESLRYEDMDYPEDATDYDLLKYDDYENLNLYLDLDSEPSADNQESQLINPIQEFVEKYKKNQ